MTGFRRDDEPRTWEAVRRPSGLWVAGAAWIDRLDPADATPAGDVYAVTERATHDPGVTARTPPPR